MSLSDLQFRQATCEVRFPDAFLIFDRTGQIFRYLKENLTHLRTESAAPAQSQVVSDEGTVVLNLGSLSFMTFTPETSLEKFAAHCKLIFDYATDRLEVRMYTRIGLRLVFIKSYKTIDEARAALNAIPIARASAGQRFKLGPEVSEWLARWESKDLGATVRLKAETGKVDAALHPELGFDSLSIHREYNHLIVDADYYTVSLVAKEQWDAQKWITISGRMIRKELEEVLS
jgi:hypothetical protein